MSQAACAKKAVELDKRFAMPERIVFVIGAQKSGTTWLDYYFQHHPEVCSPGWKELNYWNMAQSGSTGKNGRIPIRAKRGWGKLSKISTAKKLLAFLGVPKLREKVKSAKLASRLVGNTAAPHTQYADALFENWSPTSKVLVENCPQYALLSTETFAQMAALHIDVRFVFLLRDPMDRYLSGVRHDLNKQHGKSGVSQPEVEAELLKSLNNKGNVHAKRSNYQDTLACLENAVSPDEVAVFFFESLFDQAEINRLCDFVGVSSVLAETDRKVHSGAGKGVTLSADLVQKLQGECAPIYSAMQQRFGADVPASWGQVVQ